MKNLDLPIPKNAMLSLGRKFRVIFFRNRPAHTHTVFSQPIYPNLFSELAES